MPTRNRHLLRARAGRAPTNDSRRVAVAAARVGAGRLYLAAAPAVRIKAQYLAVACVLARGLLVATHNIQLP